MDQSEARAAHRVPRHSLLRTGRPRRRSARQHLIAAVSASALAAGLLLAGTGPATADVAGPIHGPGDSGKCLDVLGTAGNNGSAVDIWDCDGTADQNWTVGSDHTLRSMGRCLDVSGYGTANFSPVHLWDCHGGANQVWQPQPNGSLLNPVSGRCLDLNAGNTANGTQLQIYDCNNQWPQVWHLPGQGSGGTFGNTVIHPDKLGVYAIPDLSYGDAARTDASLRTLHALLPGAWIRWDNETGHAQQNPANVEAFVSRVNRAGIPMIIAACCVDGYDNWWARGGRQPTVSISQIADGPYLSFADHLRRTYPNVRYIETINEADTSWFVADPDNVGAWNHYMDRLYAATGNDFAHLMGPASAFRDSGIYKATVGRSEIQQISYHTYGGWQSLGDVPGKQGTWVTEYGDSSVPDSVGHSPGFVLADLRNAEVNGKLSGGIRQIFYVNLQSMVNSGYQEGDHYGFSGQLRALAAYQALGNVSTKVWADPGHNDIMAADDGSGSFAALLYNNSGSTLSGQTRTVPNTSLSAGTPLNVLTMTNRDSGAAQCVPLSGQSGVGVSVGAGSVSVTARTVAPYAAVLVTSRSCSSLAG